MLARLIDEETDRTHVVELTIDNEVLSYSIVDPSLLTMPSMIMLKRKSDGVLEIISGGRRFAAWRAIMQR